MSQWHILPCSLTHLILSWSWNLRMPHLLTHLLTCLHWLSLPYGSLHWLSTHWLSLSWLLCSHKIISWHLTNLLTLHLLTSLSWLMSAHRWSLSLNRCSCWIWSLSQTSTIRLLHWRTLTYRRSSLSLNWWSLSRLCMSITTDWLPGLIKVSKLITPASLTNCFCICTILVAS